MTAMTHSILTAGPEAGLMMTRHADARLRQRGFRDQDLDVLMRFGREMPDGTLALTDGDVEREIEAMRRRIAHLDRLRGMTAVVAAGRLVTVYKAPRRSRRRRADWEE